MCATEHGAFGWPSNACANADNVVLASMIPSVPSTWAGEGDGCCSDFLCHASVCNGSRRLREAFQCMCMPMKGVLASIFPACRPTEGGIIVARFFMFVCVCNGSCRPLGPSIACACRHGDLSIDDSTLCRVPPPHVPPPLSVAFGIVDSLCSDCLVMLVRAKEHGALGCLPMRVHADDGGLGMDDSTRRPTVCG